MSEEILTNVSKHGDLVAAGAVDGDVVDLLGRLVGQVLHQIDHLLVGLQERVRKIVNEVWEGR